MDDRAGFMADDVNPEDTVGVGVGEIFTNPSAWPCARARLFAENGKLPLR